MRLDDALHDQDDNDDIDGSKDDNDRSLVSISKIVSNPVVRIDGRAHFDDEHVRVY